MHRSVCPPANRFPSSKSLTQFANLQITHILLDRVVVVVDYNIQYILFFCTMTSSSTLTIDTEFGERDIYGQCHPIETDELIDARLKELDEELEKVKKGESWLQAKAKCPDLVGRDFLLMFLRCRKFQAEVCVCVCMCMCISVIYSRYPDFTACMN